MEHVSKADLEGFGRMAERHWRKFRPKAVAALEKEGRLYEALKEAENNAEDLYDELLKKKLPDEAIREIVLHEYILLPDIDSQDEANQPPEQTIE